MSQVATTGAAEAQRDVLGRALVEMVDLDPRVYVLDGDLANSTKVDRVQQERPERFLQMGIAEQNMVGVAAGMASLGLLPYVSTFACFLANRALDQIRVSVAQNRLPVRFVGGYAGMLTGKTGKTHQSVEDLAVFRAIPHMTVMAPADGPEAARLLRATLTWDGPVYLRLTRDAVPSLPDDAAPIGTPRWLARGRDALVLSTGTQTLRVLEAVRGLEADGVQVGLLHLPVLKPFPAEAVHEALRGVRRAVTVEDHSVIGGLGSAVAEVIAEGGHGVRLDRVGVDDVYGEAAPNDDLLRKYGLDVAGVRRRIQAAVERTG